MLNKQQMEEISKIKNVIFYKQGCPFCVTAQKLADTLVEQKVLTEYSIYILGQDFDNQSLTELALASGWKPDGIQSIVPKPQIFIQGQYIGGNYEFYKSEWNVGKNMPNLKNPMRF